MDAVELLKAVVFGIVEGITEWLPISSTGHMLLLNEFLTMDVSEDFWNMFLVVIQLGAILAVIVVFFHQLNPFSRKKSKQERHNTWVMWGKTIVACIPAAVIGLPLDDWMEENLSSPYVIAAALIIYGVIFIVIENVRENRAKAKLAEQPSGKHFVQADASELDAQALSVLADEDARVQTIDELDWKTAIGIGCFQVLSMVPGTSRSGSTIIGGLVLGCSRSVASEFSFYLAIPVMFGASGLRLVKYFLAGNTLAGMELAVLLVGCIVAFVVSLLVIRFLMNFVREHDFKPFGWYRIILGAIVILYFSLV